MDWSVRERLLTQPCDAETDPKDKTTAAVGAVVFLIAAETAGLAKA